MKEWQKKVRGRHLCDWQGNVFRKDNWAESAKGKPAGYRHSQLAFIPKSHMSSRFLQDDIEMRMRRAIAHEPAGQRRDFMIRDLELWIANGRPTGNAQRSGRRGERPKSMELVSTWGKGKPIHEDYGELRADEANRKVRKLLKLD